MSNLFTAVSVEQQEIVAGGVGPVALFGTYFAGKKIVQNGGSNSNWNGSNAGGSQGIIDVTSIGLSFLKA
jgi:hypothetical protein